ncbi:MAG: glycosyltransferase family 2 protein [bacterium]|jgi:glycosyltransferase involved in cell wall biosynthesis
MKLVIMIPCLNEETTLPLVISKIPRKIKGVESIVTLIIDDGSTDKTVEVAKNLGITEFIYHAKNRGLAHSLRDGIQRSLELGADILVLTDGDNQYPQEKIPELIKPILDGRADTVIGDRGVNTIDHFSPMKKFLQKFGTGVVNSLAGTNIPDSTSGFRAYTKEAAIKFNLIGRFNFAAETTIQASHKKLAIVSIPIKTNPKTRESRLFKSSWEHVRKSAVAMLNSFTMYRPLTVFMTVAGLLFIGGMIPFGHYLYLVLTTKNAYGAHHIQSLIIGAVLINASFTTFALGIIANLTRINRSLIEDVLEVQKREIFK